MQVRRRGPDAIEWPSFVLERSANAVRTKTVHFVAQRGRSRRDLAVVPAVHNCADQLAKCVAEIGAGDNLSRVVGDCKVSGDGDRTVFHVFGLGGVGADVRNIDHVQVEVTLACGISRRPLGRGPEVGIGSGGQVAALAVRLIQGRAFGGELGVDRRQDCVRPFWRSEAGEAVLGGGGLVSSEELFELENGVDLHAGGRELVFCNRKIYGGADAESFAGVAGHRLLDGAVVLNPFKPRGIPDTRKMYRSGVRYKIFVMVEIEREDGIADAAEGVEAGETFVDGVSLDRLFQLGDLSDLLDIRHQTVCGDLILHRRWRQGRGRGRRSEQSAMASSACTRLKGQRPSGNYGHS